MSEDFTALEKKIIEQCKEFQKDGYTFLEIASALNIVNIYIFKRIGIDFKTFKGFQKINMDYAKQFFNAK